MAHTSLPQSNERPDLDAAVFAGLREPLIRELADSPASGLVDQLVDNGWRPAQLRDRVGVLPVQPSTAQDVEIVLATLTALLDQQSPQQRHEAELTRRAEQRADATGPVPAAADERARWITTIRSGLKGRRTVPARPAVRVRPDCAVCSAEAQFFVRRDVHLCGRCVDLLAAGEVVPHRGTGS